MPHCLSVDRMKYSIELYNDYKKELKKAKEQTSAKGQREFEFFEVPVLGSFHSFCKRLRSVSYSFFFLCKALKFPFK